MGKIHLAKGLSVDAAELASQVLAAIGMRGSGKSNIMAVIAEQLLAAKVQVLILDYVGIWPSLRLEADGKTPSKFDIPVLGGNHGDISLLPTAGTLVAQTLARSGSSAVLDVSRFSKTKRCAFATDFAEALFETKKDHPGPTFFILEEAQRYIPQKVQKGQERMLGAFEEIAEVGRNFGLGLGLLSQRPQKLNKDVLNLTELLFAFQANGVLERKAIAEWVQEKEAEGRNEVKDELPSLQKGEALTWSPSWLRIYGKYQLNKKTTYDAGKTPTQARAAMKVRPLDLAVLEKDMAAVVAQGKAEDPKTLRAEIVRLNRALDDRGSAKAGPPVEVPTVPKGLEQAITRTMGLLIAFDNEVRGVAERRFPKVMEGLEEAAGLLAGTRTAKPAAWGAAKVETDQAQALARSQAVTKNGQLHKNGIVMPKERPPARPAVVVEGDDWRPGEGSGELRILQALKGGHAESLTWRQIATMAGLKAGGSSLRTYRSRLRVHGCIVENGKAVSLTSHGSDLAGDVERPMGGTELLKFWMAKLDGTTGELLEWLVTNGASGKIISKEDLVYGVNKARFTAGRDTISIDGSSLRTYISRLSANGVIDKHGGSGISAAEVFFQ